MKMKKQKGFASSLNGLCFSMSKSECTAFLYVSLLKKIVYLV